MPNEAPIFSSQPLKEVAKPKTTRRRTTTTRQRAALKIDKPSATTTAKIDRKLDSIYKDDNGSLPNMKQIKIKRRGSPILRSLFWLFLVGGLLAAAAWAGFFIMPANKISEEKVVLKINGPELLTLGATSTYTIVFENKQNISLSNVVMSVRYPKGFVFLSSSLAARNQNKNEWDLGAIPAYKKNEITITGLTYGPIDEDQSWRVFLNYKPENLNSELQKMATLITKINATPFMVALAGPDKITVGDETEYTITLETNNSTWPTKLFVAPTWPANFYITTSTLPIEKTNHWFLISTPANATSTPNQYIIKVRGKFSDSTDTSATTKVALLLPTDSSPTPYTIATATVNTELIKNSVNLAMAINGSLTGVSTRPGDILNITLSLKNTSGKDINKAVVKLNLDAPAYKKISVLDWNNIVDKNDGDIQGQQISDTIRRGQIIWRGSNIAALNKIKNNDEITIDVRLPLKDIKAISWSNITEYKIMATTEITYVDATGATQTITANPTNLIINSDLNLEIRDKVENNASGKEEHAINWVLTNTFHALKNITLSADLYGDISWQGPEKVSIGTVNYDDKTKKLIWTIPELPENVDIAALPFIVTINQKNPTQNLLVSKVRLQGEDTVTGEKLDLLGNEIGL
ncbi:MAG: hypothetical protein UR53_C0002G0039 [Candidatus Magasanikbacteria bacterium GW2011_GWC2_34_16]|uniref:DUF11 domain-containing protein n=2 Tax=Candidatus Magasanikiibacteriota TaxID=1752731 RepID=A0A0G0KKX4_9BACT|nr:MAG: hypothetical protein UR53_C0002G0039 [Candidatus Magasanikbacteria bacterium GW2011_GWC2_34_16]KKQ41236.1 MAG: hypothetical protein US58_C0003G0019 [Candidatus Magasanikbacteria bacterium GW2011_GWA2_37_8]